MKVVLFCAGMLAAEAKDCSVGGSSLCGCSELVSKGLIDSFDDCTQSAAVAACKSGTCSHAGGALQSSVPVNGTSLLSLPYSFHDDLGPFDLSWGFPQEDTIEIEFSLYSDFYVGLGFDGHGIGDAVAGWVDENGEVQVGDYWDEGSRQPLTDESRGCRNDVQAVSGSYVGGVTTIRFRRKLDTGDREDCDKAIVRGPMDINYAFCDSPFCADARGTCNGYESGCLDSAHGPGAWNVVTVDFSGAGHGQHTVV